jgi:hypothetical protein
MVEASQNPAQSGWWAPHIKAGPAPTGYHPCAASRRARTAPKASTARRSRSKSALPIAPRLRPSAGFRTRKVVKTGLVQQAHPRLGEDASGRVRDAIDARCSLGVKVDQPRRPARDGHRAQVLHQPHLDMPTFDEVLRPHLPPLRDLRHPNCPAVITSRPSRSSSSSSPWRHQQPRHGVRRDEGRLPELVCFESRQAQDQS